MGPGHPFRRADPAIRAASELLTDEESVDAHTLTPLMSASIMNDRVPSTAASAAEILFGVAA